MNRQKFETVMDIYENNDDFRTVRNTNQPLRQTGSRVKIRNYRAATVCLVLLCVLLLTAVIVLCVLINTNNHQLHNLIDNKDQLLPKNKKLTEERNQLLTKNKKLTEEREQLLKSRNGWILYDSSYYFFSSEQKSWSESRRYCRQREADLMIINNREEQDFVNRMSGKQRIWIGLSDSDKEGRWKWVDSSTLTSGFWESEEPNGQRTENCAVSESSGWHDYPCNDQFKWICEKIFL